MKWNPNENSVSLTVTHKGQTLYRVTWSYELFEEHPWAAQRMNAVVNYLVGAIKDLEALRQANFNPDAVISAFADLQATRNPPIADGESATHRFWKASDIGSSPYCGIALRMDLQDDARATFCLEGLVDRISLAEAHGEIGDPYLETIGDDPFDCAAYICLRDGLPISEGGVFHLRNWLRKAPRECRGVIPDNVNGVDDESVLWFIW